MRHGLMLKLVILSGLALMLAVALLFIGGVVSEREGYRDKVVGDVAQSVAKRQTVVGPLLVVPYQERLEVAGPTPGSKAWQVVRGESVLLPESLECRASVHVETRTRGIYRAPVFRARLHLAGAFRIPARLGLPAGRAPVPSAAPSLVLGVTDMRGLRRPPQLRWDGAPAKLEPGTRLAWVGQGVSAPGAVEPADEARTVPFDADLDLLGTDQISIVPVGASTAVHMESDWPHPAFTGGFLPDTRSVSGAGFRADWQLSQYATGIADAVDKWRAAIPDALAGLGLAVRFVEPVDVYRESERATKYGMLFVLLTFVTFFLFEVLRDLAIHPVQYGLTGAAVALFFLLLLSLSEYVPFAAAYLIASGACVGLLAFYVGHVLRSAVRGAAFAAFLATLYAVLYVLLQSEDFALLLGTLLLFGVLAAIMVMTRRVDWYRTGSGAPDPGPRPRES